MHLLALNEDLLAACGARPLIGGDFQATSRREMVDCKDCLATLDRGNDGSFERCDECGRKIAECNAIAVGRSAAEQYLRDVGYGSLEARNTSVELIPHSIVEMQTPPAGKAGEPPAARSAHQGRNW